MTVSEAVRRLTADPEFWAAMRPAATHHLHPSRPDAVGVDAGEIQISFPVAGGYGLTLDLDPGTGEQHLGLRIPTTSEPIPLGWAAPDQPHPAALRWWELDLCARVIALADPTLPHPGLVVALLSPFAPPTPDDDYASIAAVREAAYRSLRPAGEPSASDPAGAAPEQAPLPLFTAETWWPDPPEPSPHLLDEESIAAWTTPAPILIEVRNNPRFPADHLAQLIKHADAQLARLREEPGYSDVTPMARQIVARADLTDVNTLVSALTEAGCDHPTVLDALSEPLIPTEACWMVETLAGAAPGTLLRHLAGANQP